MRIQFFVPGTPAPMPRPRVNTKTGHVFSNDARTREWKERVILAANVAGIRKLSPALGPITLTLSFVMPIKGSGIDGDPHVIRPDGDNLAKSAIDACTLAGAWKDDCQIYDMKIIKRYGETPGVLITIEG